MPQLSSNPQRVLVYTESNIVSRTVIEVLTQQDDECVVCPDAETFCRNLADGAGAAVISRQVLQDEALERMAAQLKHEPNWSRPNVIVLLQEGEEIRADAKGLSVLEERANLNFLETPVKAGQLARAVRSALADRVRQYQIRDLMTELEISRHDAVEASRAKSDFLANMSHEIRTPLGAILGFTELMMDSGVSRREKKDYMVAARRNGQMLSALIDDILDLSRVEAGRLELAKLEFSLGELVSEFISALEPQASKKNLPLSVTKPKDIDQIIGDPIRIKQILLNIVGNAIKFTSHGFIEVRMKINAEKSSPSILSIEVEDTGIGISAQQAAQLFKPFTQADSSSTRRFGGTGLGLVLSQRLARAMGGDLKLQWSIPGGGSSFLVTLPVVVSARRRPERDSPVPGLSETKLPLAGSRILLVDDSLDNQMLISRILRLLGAEVELANDGLEGMDKAMADVYDVVLMDLQMPRLGGVEATRRLRSRGYTRPIVALTAHAMQEDRQRCISVGCTDYLTKPVQRGHLVQVIERVAHLRSGEGTGH